MTLSSCRNSAEVLWQKMENSNEMLIQVGTGTCGIAAGADKILSRIEETVRHLDYPCCIQQVGCIGMCYMEPIVALRMPQDPFVYFGNLTPDTVEKILIEVPENRDEVYSEAFCSRGAKNVEGLPRFEDLPMIRPQVRIATRNCGLIDPENIDHYLARGGYRGLEKALGMTPETVIGQIKKSGLRGRGGAGFPTGMKWEFARNNPKKKKYFVCNADEGDPGAFMDRSLLEGDPHSVLEGLSIGSWAVGAEKAYVYVQTEYPLAIRRLCKAIEQMEAYGLLGNNILNSGFSLAIDIKEGAGAFVCGEETGLMASIMGERAAPRSRPPFPAESGIDGYPTNINNVETLSNVSAILDRGAEWYAGFGTERSRGTKTFSLTGNIRRTGLIEVPMGMELGEIIYDIGGGLQGNKKLKAVQTGGPSGGCIPASLLSLPVEYESLAEAGSIMGSGGMIVMDEDTCIVEMARYFLNFNHEESCGKCTSCRLGTGAMLGIVEDITTGHAAETDLDLLTDLCETVRKGSLCGLGQTAPNSVLSTLRYFRSEYDDHIRHRRCPAVVCTSLFEAPCSHACPLGTNIPAVIALVRENRIGEACRILLRTNPLPGVCGRICNHPCQFKCPRGTLDESVSIRNIERFVSDHAYTVHPETPPLAHGNRIAVVGSGPAGLAAARQLRLHGYPVTLFESLSEPGGMLRYAIPEYRLPAEILNREINAILDLGIELKTSTRVGRDLPWVQLVDAYSMVVLAVGAQKSAVAGFPGEDLEEVQGALEFLRSVRSESVSCMGEKVAVIGGGNSAISAARTALRLGAVDVCLLTRELIENMDAQKEEIDAAGEEGVRIECLTAPTGFSIGEGNVKKLSCQRLKPGPYDLNGRRKPIPAGYGYREIEVDRVLVATGQATDLPFRGNSHGIRVDSGGWISVAEGTSNQTTHPKVFAAGDVTAGPANVAEAIAAGFRAASEIDRALQEEKREPLHTLSPHVPVKLSMEMPGDNGDIPCEKLRQRKVKSRIRNFSEVRKGYRYRQASREAERCLRCDIKTETEEEPLSSGKMRA